MFIETHTSGGLTLTFINSTNVNVFPSGRRRSQDVGIGKRIPFDPEARLNTEANNRKYSGLNGYTQTFLKEWDNRKNILTLSLAGYLFDITLDSSYVTINKIEEEVDGKTKVTDITYTFKTTDFGNAIATKTGDGQTATKIYANILLEDVQLFQGEPKDYYTSILRNQSATTDYTPEPALDLIANKTTKDEEDKYYFSGLSFSVTPASGIDGTRSEIIKLKDANINQTVVSLCILEKDGSDWKIHEPAKLPEIEHGTTANSIIVGDTTVKIAKDENGNPVNLGKLTVEGKIVTPVTEITSSLNVTNVNADATATINKLAADSATIDDIIADTITVNKEITVKDDTAKITITNSDETAKTVITPTEVQSGKLTQNGCAVPAIGLVQDGDYWQLQITLDASKK